MLGQEHTPEYFVMGMCLSKMTECISRVQLAMTKYHGNKKEKEREGEKYHGPFLRDFTETFPVTPSCQF